jgi:hypothetical protein
VKPIVHAFRWHRQGGRWPFVLDTDLRITFGDNWGWHEFADDGGRVWCRTEGHDWILVAGYAWDGASMAINFPSTIAASCWHDGAGQFRHLGCIKDRLSGGVWNGRFAEIIAGMGAPWVARVYWLGLAIGNPVYGAIGRWLGRKGSGKCLSERSVGCVGSVGSVGCFDCGGIAELEGRIILR